MKSLPTLNVLHSSEGKGERGNIKSKELPAMHLFFLPFQDDSFVIIHLLCRKDLAPFIHTTLGATFMSLEASVRQEKSSRFPGKGWRRLSSRCTLAGIHHPPTFVGRRACLGEGLCWAAPRLGWQQAIHRGKQWDFERVYNFFPIIKDVMCFVCRLVRFGFDKTYICDPSSRCPSK